jgi:hypothetical protein
MGASASSKRYSGKPATRGPSECTLYQRTMATGRWFVEVAVARERQPTSTSDRDGGVRAARRTGGRLAMSRVRRRPSPLRGAQGAWDASQPAFGARRPVEPPFRRLKREPISSSAVPFGFRRLESRSSAPRHPPRVPVWRQAAPRPPSRGPVWRRPAQGPS